MASSKRKKEEVSASFFDDGSGLFFKVVKQSPAGTDLITTTNTAYVHASRRGIDKALALLGYVRKSI